MRVRAPGRVNLIGEHTDYSHLPVLPMAIDRALIVTVTGNATGRVTAASESFEGVVDIVREEPDTRVRGWGSYVAGALRELTDVAPGLGASIHIAGDLPGTGGLSSSSALTVGMVAGLNEAWGAGLDREGVVARAEAAERHAGVETGGMDQQAIAFATEGHALRIDFRPPSRRPVPVPRSIAFVVAYSGEAAAKGGEARAAYNERVVGARFAAALLGEMIGLDPASPPRLGDLAMLPESDLLVEELAERANAQHVARATGILAASLVSLSHGSLEERETVPVRRYARHILSEAHRVNAAEVALLRADLPSLGTLFDESHESLRKDLGCSTAALDEVCAAMRRAGAAGARLTGAGFGGYAVGAVGPESVEAVIAAAEAATGGPAFEVRASAGYEVQ